MNIAELAEAVAAKADISKSDAAKAVKATFDAITEGLTAGKKVSVPGFGAFDTTERGERQGRNPQTGQAITIAASKSAKFKAGKALKDALNG